MRSTTSIFAQIVDKVRLMNEEQQKLLWLQLNQDMVYAGAARADKSVKKGQLIMDDIVKITRNVRRPKKKN